MSQTDLADLGNWSSVKIDGRSHKVIRHAYEHVISASARLASFSTGSPTVTSGPINERQESLAIDDLVDFAIHARRLVANTATQRRFTRVQIRSLREPNGSRLAVTRIINMLIHHEDIEIVRTEWKAKHLMGIRLDLDDLLLSSAERHFPPGVVVRSDGGKKAIFDLRELIETFQKEILVPVIELCDEQELSLEDF